MEEEIKNELKGKLQDLENLAYCQGKDRAEWGDEDDFDDYESLIKMKKEEILNYVMGKIN